MTGCKIPWKILEIVLNTAEVLNYINNYVINYTINYIINITRRSPDDEPPNVAPYLIGLSLVY